MALSAFDDRTSPPQNDTLAAALGPALAHWNELRRVIAAAHGPLTEEWGFTSKSTGWGLRLKHGRRAVLYLTPREGYFLASLALGEKAVHAARESDLPASVVAIIDSARKYAEGRGVRLEVRTAADVQHARQLAAIKMTSTS